MNDNHLNKSLIYKKRWLVSSMVQAVETQPVVVLTGARQVGKSTLLMNEYVFKDWKYIGLDDFNLLAQAESDPFSLWAGVDRVILDEVQKSPKILSAIKQTVDRERFRKRFILSGSANILLMHKVSESLAGRAVFMTLFPMAIGETKGTDMPNILSRFLKDEFPQPKILKNITNPYPHMIKGLMPALLALNTKENYLRWWEGYIATYLERDLRQLTQIESLPEYRKVMEAVALRTGQLTNQTEIARGIGIGQSTVYRYINLLETTCLLKKIPAYARSRTKRLIKSPKYYFIDPGLTCYLSGVFDETSLKSDKCAGYVFETMVLLHLTILCELMVPKIKIFYWRTVTGKEVDFVLEYGKNLIPIEVKLSTNPTYQDTAGLRTFLKEYPNVSKGIIIYPGREIKYLAENILAIPWIFFIKCG